MKDILFSDIIAGVAFWAVLIFLGIDGMYTLSVLTDPGEEPKSRWKGIIIAMVTGLIIILVMKILKK